MGLSMRSMKKTKRMTEKKRGLTLTSKIRFRLLRQR